MGGSKDAYVTCPFYRGVDGRNRLVKCEGPDGSDGITIAFRNQARFAHHINYYCEQWYKYCPIYYGLMTKYGDELVRE